MDTVTRGRALAERLGLKIIGTEGHDLKLACVACDSSDGGRVHSETGVYFCYVCNKALSAFDLAKVALKDHQAAIDAMVQAGLFEPSGGNGHAPTDPVEIIARAKRIPVAAFRAYGAVPCKDGVRVPMYGPDQDHDGRAVPCSSMTIAPNNGKGKYEADKPTGLFLPNGRLPQDGEAWCIVEGVKDAAALFDLGHLAAGLPGASIKPDLAPLFRGVDTTVVPDADVPGEKGAVRSCKLLYATAARLRKIKLPMVEVVESHGQDVRDVLAMPGGREALLAALRDAPEVDSRGHPIPPPRFARLVSSADFDDMDLKTEYLVEHVLAEGQPGVVGGRSKTLKTSIACDLALSLGAGVPFLGRFEARQVNVGFWSGESGAATLRRTARRIAAAKGITLRDCSVRWSFDLPRLSDASHLAILGDLIRQHDLKVVLVDPLYLSLLSATAGGKPSDLFFMGSVLQPLTELGQALGCTIILLHHFRKTGLVDPQEPAGLEELSQSGIAEWSRQWLLIQRRVPYQDDGHHELWFRAGGSAGHAGLWALTVDEGTDDDPQGRRWQVALDGAADARQATEARREKAKEDKQAEALEKDKAKIVETMLRLGTDTRFNIRDASGIRDTRFKVAFAELLRDGHAIACELTRGNRKAPYTAYKLAEG